MSSGFALSPFDKLSALPLQEALEMDRLPFEVVVREHLSLVWRVLRRAGVAEADCDDVCQEVFCTYAEKQSAVRPGAERAYVISVALRKASDYRRSAYQRRHRLESSPGLDQQSMGLSPESQVAVQEKIQVLDRMLQELPENFRSVFVLLEVEQMSIKEVAEALRIPTGTVSSRMHRARARFDDLLRSHLGGSDE